MLRARVRGAARRPRRPGDPADLRDLRRGLPREPDDAGRTSPLIVEEIVGTRRRGSPRRSGSWSARRRSVGALICGRSAAALSDRTGFRPVLVGSLVDRRDGSAGDAARSGGVPARAHGHGVHGVQRHGRGDGLQPARDRGPARAPLGDSQPRLPAALRGGDRRADDRRDRWHRSRGRAPRSFAARRCSSARRSWSRCGSGGGRHDLGGPEDVGSCLLVRPGRRVDEVACRREVRARAPIRDARPEAHLQPCVAKALCGRWRPRRDAPR